MGLEVAAFPIDQEFVRQRGNFPGDAQVFGNVLQDVVEVFGPGLGLDAELGGIKLPAFAHILVMHGPGAFAKRGFYRQGNRRFRLRFRQGKRDFTKFLGLQPRQEKWSGAGGMEMSRSSDRPDSIEQGVAAGSHGRIVPASGLADKHEFAGTGHHHPT